MKLKDYLFQSLELNLEENPKDLPSSKQGKLNMMLLFFLRQKSHPAFSRFQQKIASDMKRGNKNRENTKESWKPVNATLRWVFPFLPLFLSNN